MSTLLPFRTLPTPKAFTDRLLTSKQGLRSQPAFLWEKDGAVGSGSCPSPLPVAPRGSELHLPLEITHFSTLVVSQSVPIQITTSENVNKAEHSISSSSTLESIHFHEKRAHAWL